MLASDLAGDPSRDPLPLLDSELDPNELDELERLPFDPHSDAESSSEEEPDCEHCREGDLVHSCIWMESGPQRKKGVGVHQHLSQSVKVLWKWRWMDLPSLWRLHHPRYSG